MTMLQKFLKNYGDEKVPLYLANDIGKILGMQNIRAGVKNFKTDEKMTNYKIKMKDRNGVSKNRQVTMLTLKGVKRVICSSRKQAPQWMLDQLEITCHNSWVTPIETSIIDKILKIFPDEKFIHQFSCKNYLVDLYHPARNICIEVDENNHNHYDVEKEERRTTTINIELNPTWIRFNADDLESFYSKCGEITTALYK